MVSDIIDGISVRLNEAFGDEYEIYSENVEQGLVEPCFFIQHVVATNEPYLGTRRKHSYNFDIHYFGTSNEDMLAMSDKMMDELELITLLNGDKLRGMNMSAQIVDDVLHFSIDYPVVLITTKDVVKMDKYNLSQKLGE